MPELFTPESPLECPDCKVEGVEFMSHPLVGWLCPKCYVRAQRACEGIVAYSTNRSTARQTIAENLGRLAAQAELDAAKIQFGDSGPKRHLLHLAAEYREAQARELEAR